MVGIFLIATGKYIDFVKPLVDDINKYFLVDHKKTIYVFTDSDKDIPGVVKVYQEHKPFPYPTLYRYYIITEYCDVNKIQHEYAYYLDVDMKIVAPVGDEILGDLVATKHPGFYNKGREYWAHNRNFLCRAYTPWHKMKAYYAGAVNGGRKYLDMAHTIVEWIDKDQEYVFIPDWHDESYSNRYFALNPPDVVLDPSYCMPDDPIAVKNYGLTKMVPKILCLTKDIKYLKARVAV